MDKMMRLKIEEIREETAEAKTFFLSSHDAHIDYAAGQFLTFLFPKGDDYDRRNYSISSAPHEKRLSVTVKKIANGEYSRRLVDKATVGDELLSIGASGFFTLPESIATVRQIFFFAAGSGITPVYSLIKDSLFNYPQVHLVLVYSNVNEQRTIFIHELRRLAALHPQLRVIWLFSESKQLSRARLSKSLIEELVTEALLVPREEAFYYLCGSFDYMRMATIQLLTIDIPVTHIRKEQFEIIRQDDPPTPPDVLPHRVTITSNGRTDTLVVQHPQTILRAAKTHRIDLPYSCEAGRCGTCAMRCVEGTVWMSYNEVLLDEEIEKGWVLTCTGYPVGGDVVLR
jgi:ferredoxin-NADP reductase